jgi:hypothetical protein
MGRVTGVTPSVSFSDIERRHRSYSSITRLLLPAKISRLTSARIDFAVDRRPMSACKKQPARRY